MHTIMPGEQHRPARGVERLDRRLLAGQPPQHALAVAGDDEQRVVDADAEPDQQRELARERGHVDRVREQADHRDPGARARSRRPAAAAAIASSEPNTRNSTIAAARKPNTRLARAVVLRCPAWAIWPSTSNWTPLPVAEVTLRHERLRRGVAELVGLDVEGDVGERDLARGRDLPRAAGGVRRVDRRDVRLARDRGEHAPPRVRARPDRSRAPAWPRSRSGRCRPRTWARCAAAAGSRRSSGCAGA